MEKTIVAEKKMLIAVYDDRLVSYKSQYSAYMTWLDEDDWTGLILVASMEDRFSTEIVELERSHQMRTFIRSRYEPTGQSTFLAAIRQEQLLRQGDATVDAFFD
jgi:hypothetical protein